MFRQRSRRLIGVYDAAFSSAGNFMLSFIGAHALSLEGFGDLSMIFIVIVLALGVWKVYFVDPFTLSFSSADIGLGTRSAGEVLGSAILVSIAFSAVALAGIVATQGLTDSAPPVSVVLAVVAFPLLVSQDCLRWMSYALGKPIAALASSATWTALAVPGLLALVASGRATTNLMLGVWASSAVGGLIASLMILKIRPNFRRAGMITFRNTSISFRTTADYLLTQALGQGGTLLMGVFLGSAAVGLIRIVQLPFAVVPVCIAGVIAVLQPSMLRDVAAGEERTARRRAAQAAVWLCVPVAIICVVLMLPFVPVEMLLGDSWGAARHLVLPVAAIFGGSCLAAAFGPYLRATGLLSFQVKSKFWVAVLTLTILFPASLGGVLSATVVLGVGSLVIGILALQKSYGREVS